MTDRFILQDEAARTSLLRGIERMTRVIRPTLGPVGRTVAVARTSGTGTPEILDNAATIARRTLRLEDPFESMGGRLIRDLVWRVHKTTGDGSATSAVLAHQLVREAARYVAAGYNPMLLKRGIEHGLCVALNELSRLSRPIDHPSDLAGVVAGTLRNDDLARMVGEIVDSVGPDGAILLEDSQRAETRHQYLEGVRWNEGVASSYLMDENQTEARLVNPRIFVTNYHLKSDHQLVPVIEACVKANERDLFVIAPTISDSALALLILNRKKGVLDNAIAVKAPGLGTQRRRILEDLAVITGSRLINEDNDDQFEDLMIHDLGQARQVWTTRFSFGILGAAGSKGAIRQRLSEVRDELRNLGDDIHARKTIQERIGKLAGTAAVIRVGAQTKIAREELRFRLEAAVESARLASREGVVPGGGAAYIACRPALDALSVNGDEAMGVQILRRSLAAPMAAITENAGLDASSIVYNAEHYNHNLTFDVLRQEWVDPWEEAILDPLGVAQEALRSGASAAMMAITTDVLIRKKKVNWEEEEVIPRRPQRRGERA